MSGVTDKDIMNAVGHLSDLNGVIQKYFPDDLKCSIELVTELARQIVEKGIRIPGPPDKRMEHMTEPELSAHLRRQLQFIKGCQSEDTIGSMLIIFQQDGICQYGATIHPEDAPKALRELADRLERRETVERN